jgi:hypothetical protein
LLQRQAALDLPDPRNAGFPHLVRPVADVSRLVESSTGVFSSGLLAIDDGEACHFDAISATCGIAASGGNGGNGVFSTLLTTPNFSCARVVAPHISPTGGNFPLSGSANETQPEQPQKMRAMGPASFPKNQTDCSKESFPTWYESERGSVFPRRKESEA